MSKKYKLLKPIDNCSLEAGKEYETNIEGFRQAAVTGHTMVTYASPIEIALLIATNFLEECREWDARKLKELDEYWTILENSDEQLAIHTKWNNDKQDKWRLANNNIHPTEAAAIAWRDGLLGKAWEV